MSATARLLRPSSQFTPRSISGLALWLDGSDTASLYTTDAGSVTAVTAPTDISGCVLWLDGADSSSASMTLNGSLVETWKDKSGSNNNATAAGTARPTLTSGGLNGKSVVTFDGTANAMQIAANAAFNSNDLTYFVVFRQDTVANKGVYTKLTSTAGTSGFGLVVRSDPSIWLLQKNSGAPQVLSIAANPTTQARIYTVTSSSTAAGYLDGLLSVNAASTADHSLVQRVMVGSRDSSEYLNGYVAEVIHYNRVLTRSELAQVEAMLAAKWGISGVHRSAAQEITAVSSPLELAGCAGWWDASRTDAMWNATSGGSLVANGGAVQRLDDISGRGKHLVQSTSAAAPLRQDAGLNSLPVLDFSAGRWAIAGTNADWNFLHNSQGGTVLMVVKPSASGDSQTYGYLLQTSGGGASTSVGLNLFYDDRPSYPRNNYFNVAITHGVSGQGTAFVEYNNFFPQADQYWLVSAPVSAGNATASQRANMYRDGVRYGSTNSNTFAPSTANSYSALQIGHPTNSIGGIAEIIVYERTLSDVDRARVEKYLQQKWATATVPDPTPPVGYWADKSGNNRHATQSTAASRPTISATALNGRRQLGLVSQHLRGPSATWTGSASIYWVGKTGQTTNGAIVFSDGAVDQTDGFHAGWLYQQGVGAYGNGWNAGNAPRAESPTAWRNADIVAGVTLSSTESVARVNGATTNTVSALTGSLSQASAAQFYVGREASNVWNNINGSISELLIYQPALNASQRQRLERYLAAKWGITLAPQASNADAQDWVNRVYANGGSVSTATASEVNTFCEAIAAVSGLREKFYRLNLFAGTGLNACLVPLFRGTAWGVGGNVLTKNTANDGGSFASSVWSAVNAATKGAAATAPDGTATALSVTLAGGPSYAALRMSIGSEWVANATGTFSVWARKPASGGAASIRLATNNTSAWSTGVYQKFTLTTDWQRISVTGTVSNNTGGFALIGTVNGADGSHDSDCNGVVELWRPQIEFGSTATAWQACQYGNTTDINSGGLFVSADYAEMGPGGGLLGDGSSKYLNTGLSIANIGTFTSGHLSVYHGQSTGTNVNRYYLAANDAATSNRFFLGTDAFSTSQVLAIYGATLTANQSLAPQGHGSAGHRILSRANSASLTHYHNGAVVGSNSTDVVGGGALCTAPFPVFCQNSNGTYSRFHNSWIAAYSIGLGMDSNQVAAYTAAMQAFQAALGRSV